MKPLIIAHRGDSSRALENSREAFRLALDLPVDMIEFDVRKSRDNRLYVMHDNDTGRTADRRLRIERALSGEIERVRLRNGEFIPALEEALSLVNGKTRLNIEVKSEGAGFLTGVCLSRSGYQGPVLVSSFKEQEVMDALRTKPDIAAACVFDSFRISEADRYASRGLKVISLNKKTVTAKLVEELHRRHLKVYVWTVDDEEEMIRFAGLEVDGIYSNRPAVLKRVVEGLG